MTVPVYVVEETNGNPRILQQQNNGTYVVITHGAGEKTTDDLVQLVIYANAYLEQEDEA